MDSTDCDTFRTYEDYLDSKITQNDLFYLGSLDMARRRVEYGRIHVDMITREQFGENKRIAAETALAAKEQHIYQLASAGCNITAQQPLLQALADREEAVHEGRLQTIIFVRDANANGQEVSGYIDFGHRLKKGDMKSVFSGSRRLLPYVTDLSFYNWATQTSMTNATEGFQAFCDVQKGVMVLKSKLDGHAIHVDPACAPGSNSTCTHLETHEFQQVVLFDHIPGTC